MTREGQKVARPARDRCHLFGPGEIEGIQDFIKSQDEAGRQVFGATPGTWRYFTSVL